MHADICFFFEFALFSVQTLRGVGANVIYCEEAAYMDLAVFYEVIVPLLEVGNTTMIMISTPVDSFNFFSTLFSLKDSNTGAPLFLTCDCELICKRCKEKSTPSDCTHMLKNLPPWKSVDNQRSVKDILKHHQAILQRESMGVVTDDGTALIDRRTLDRFRSRELWRPSATQRAMFRWCMVTLDPNASGRLGSSETALVAMVVHNGQYVIVGMDSHPCSSAEEVKMLVHSFLTRLQSVPELQGSKFIFCAERNMAHESGFIAFFVREQFPGSYAIMQHANNDYGWYTTHDQKIRYAYSLVGRLAEDSLVFSHRALCGQPEFLGTLATTANEERWQSIKNKLYEQLSRYRVVQSAVHNALTIAKTTVSGKVDKEGRVSGSFNDDLVFALSMSTWLCSELLQRRLPNFPHDQVL